MGDDVNVCFARIQKVLSNFDNVFFKFMRGGRIQMPK